MTQQTHLSNFEGPWYVCEDDPTCPDCGSQFETFRGVRNHYTKSHERPYPWVSKWVCDECGEQFKRRESEVKSTSGLKFCDRSCRATFYQRKRKASNPATFNLEGSHGYPRWTFPKNVAVHQLVVIADGADPYKVFGNHEYSVDHLNGCKIDNRHHNLELIEHRTHGEKDKNRQVEAGYTHKELLSILGFILPVNQTKPFESQKASEEP